jgi:hypothetical protein
MKEKIATSEWKVTMSKVIELVLMNTIWNLKHW